MRTRRFRVLAGLLLGCLLLAPVAAWLFIKPFRVVAPTLAGVTCVNDRVCTDDMAHYAEAARLYGEALKFVNTSVGAIKHPPRIIFCHSDACNRSFGVGHRAGMTVGTFGIVIGARGWKSYYVRHEIIHHLQDERLGLFTALREPKWFTEGMAYALSGDPRPLLSKPFEQDRSRFKQWYKTVGQAHLWDEARVLK